MSETQRTGSENNYWDEFYSSLQRQEELMANERAERNRRMLSMIREGAFTYNGDGRGVQWNVDTAQGIAGEDMQEGRPVHMADIQDNSGTAVYQTARQRDGVRGETADDVRAEGVASDSPPRPVQPQYNVNRNEDGTWTIGSHANDVLEHPRNLTNGEVERSFAQAQMIQDRGRMETISFPGDREQVSVTPQEDENKAPKAKFKVEQKEFLETEYWDIVDEDGVSYFGIYNPDPEGSVVMLSKDEARFICRSVNAAIRWGELSEEVHKERFE